MSHAPSSALDERRRAAHRAKGPHGRIDAAGKEALGALLQGLGTGAEVGWRLGTHRGSSIRLARLNRPPPGMHPVDVSNLAELGDRLVVVFDGHCGLCNWTVRWLMRRDRRDRLRFAASESEIAAALLARHGINLPDAKSVPATILVVLNFGDLAERVLARSEAVLALLAELPQPWPPVASVLHWLPRSVRDLGYRLVARWRYRIWGRLEVCTIPGADERERFL